MADDPIARIHARLAQFRAGDADALISLLAPDFFGSTPRAGEPDAITVWSRFLRDVRAAAPDLSIDIPDLRQGDDGALVGTAIVTGTVTSPLWRVTPAPSPRRYELPVTLREVDGRFAIRLDLQPPQALAILRDLEVINAADAMHLPPRHPVSLPGPLVKVLFDGAYAERPCIHVDQAQLLMREADRCDDCPPEGFWPALRLCLTCGHVGCCDTSVRKHARGHFEATGHPLMRSISRDEAWGWCYVDEATFDERALGRIAKRLATESGHGSATT